MTGLWPEADVIEGPRAVTVPGHRETSMDLPLRGKGRRVPMGLRGHRQLDAGQGEQRASSEPQESPLTLGSGSGRMLGRSTTGWGAYNTQVVSQVRLVKSGPQQGRPLQDARRASFLASASFWWWPVALDGPGLDALHPSLCLRPSFSPLTTRSAVTGPGPTESHTTSS